MDIIYLVVGSSGEYEEHSKWFVAFYERKGLAEIHVALATKRANELIQKYGKYKEWRNKVCASYGDIPKDANEYDSEMQVDYTGVNYNIEEVKKGFLK